MNPQLLFVEETLDSDGDIVWSYGTRDGKVSGASYDHRMPTKVAADRKLTIRYVVTPRGW